MSNSVYFLSMSFVEWVFSFLTLFVGFVFTMIINFFTYTLSYISE